ncbi:hypothetical protein EsDP_00001474 [Epichloe bromicola]|uniref:RecA family profile 1 domain-containing protein n=1 Tax=Epichloe bromicola TaxID=79588 RepID=A0ABQ0CHZ1_9HYPO
MDYHSIHGYDLSSFDVPGTHRLPTVQASQALNDLQDGTNLYISTGLEGLDKALLSRFATESQNASHHGGVKRGQVTELWGPPGTGRTAIAIQLASNSIRNADNVVWIDCFQELQVSRLEDALRTRGSSAVNEVENDEQASNSRGKFIHFSCLTLPHLMALISRPNARAIPERVALVIISNLSALINSSLPKAVEETTTLKPKKGQSASIKRRQGLQFIINALQKLAATKNCAVVVVSQCATKMQSEHGATLVPAVNASAWNQGISTRLVMFRDWAWQDGNLVSVFLAGLQKVDGKPDDDAMAHVAAFRIDSTGVTSVEYNTTSVPAEPAVAIQLKRKMDATDLEVPDSEDDEDYGWAEEDESTLPQPPQWQGSEDILLGQELGRSDDEREDDCESVRSILSEASH